MATSILNLKCLFYKIQNLTCWTDLAEEGVGPAVEVSLLGAGLAAGGRAEGVQRLVRVDDVVVPGLGSVLAPGLAWGR